MYEEVKVISTKQSFENYSSARKKVSEKTGVREIFILPGVLQ